MNSINEKEKKLNLALEELKNLDLTNPHLINNIENLNLQKNQLIARIHWKKILCTTTWICKKTNTKKRNAGKLF